MGGESSFFPYENGVYFGKMQIESAQGLFLWYGNVRFERGVSSLGTPQIAVLPAVDAPFAKTKCTDGTHID